ncbi:nuclease-related domain-containing protein [Virgibacillus sp. W0181]|uniref:nuclease-related domain-containing protein n=1 Tax=Virgibacillus sp. W0181 TaxID=3391581 RepID=UPI003F44BB8E
MIVKPHVIPQYLLQLEALNRRLPPEHKNKKSVQNRSTNLRTGFNGETALVYYLQLLPSAEFHILHDLRIPDDAGLFQLDILILSASFALIIEVKNIYGTITFDGMGQAIRTTEHLEEGFHNPIEQVNIQKMRLINWLRKNEFPNIPVEGIVVYSNTNTILKNPTNSKMIANTVMHKEKLLSKMEEIRKKHVKSIYTPNQIKHLSNKLKKTNTPKQENVLKKFEVRKEELLRGVICSNCEYLAMEWKNGKWNCFKCGYRSSDSHLNALNDYSLLISPMITNREARQFLNIHSTHIVKRLLQKSGYPAIGEYKSRKYLLHRKEI